MSSRGLNPCPHLLLPCQKLVTYDTTNRNIWIGMNYVLTTKCHLQKGWEPWQRHCSYSSAMEQGMVPKPRSSASFSTSGTTLIPSAFEPGLLGASLTDGPVLILTLSLFSRHFLRTRCRLDHSFMHLTFEHFFLPLGSLRKWIQVIEKGYPQQGKAVQLEVQITAPCPY